MACLGGTPEDPREWVWVAPEADRQITGRICERMAPRTSKAYCYACPAFRGMDREGNLQTGVAPNGEPIGFSRDEYELWQDDPEKFWARQENGFHWQTLEGAEIRAEYMRSYRARNAAYRAREVAAATARVKRQRAAV